MDENRRTGFTVALVTAAALVLPAAYVLAAGPVNALMNYGCIPRGSLAWTCAAFAYRPISWLMEHSEPVNSVMTWYLDLWM